MKEKELNHLGGIGFYICWDEPSFKFVYSAHPPKGGLLFEINEKWVFEDERTASIYCNKLNEAMEKSGHTKQSPPIKHIENGTRVHIADWSTEEGQFRPLRGYFEPIIQHLYRQVFLSEEDCQNYCNHLNVFVNEVAPK